MTAAKVMPVDLTLHMGLSRRAAMRQHVDVSSYRTQYTFSRLCTPSETSHPTRAVTPPRLSPTPISPTNSSGSDGMPKKKKRVVFADAKGLALADVRLFTADAPESTPDTIFLEKKLNDQPPIQDRILRLRLGFPQPSADLPSFLRGLAVSLVRLESCSLTGGVLNGTVRVCNISLEKAVHIRITFNSWRTHMDIPCTSIQQPPGSETELFVFAVPFSSDLNLQDRVEFRVLYRPRCSSTLLWDDNGGQNYRIMVDVVDPEEVPSVQNRPFITLGTKRAQTWPRRKSLLAHYLTCHSPLGSSKNMIFKPLNRQENTIPLC